MNAVTLAIPLRWSKAEADIESFLGNKTRLEMSFIEPFKVYFTPPLDQGQIWAFDSTLTSSQALFCDAAVTALNTALDAKTSEGWRVIKDVTEQA